MQSHRFIAFKKTALLCVEVVFVLLIGFGLFIWHSTNQLIQHTGVVEKVAYNSSGFYGIVIYELMALSLIAFYLKSRQWKLSDFNLQFTWDMIGAALLLTVLRWVIGIVLVNFMVLLSVIPSSSNEPELVTQFSLLSMSLVVIVNSIYEEVLLIGYVFKRFEKLNPALIILFSLIIRMSYHTYQGWFNMPMVFAMGLLFGGYYFKYKKLWPLIMAHAFGNLFALLNGYYQWLNY